MRHTVSRLACLPPRSARGITSILALLPPVLLLLAGTALAEPDVDAREVPDGEPVRHVVEVGRGDTLMDVLTAAEVPRAEASDAVEVLREVFDPRSLRVGQQVTVTVEPRRGAPHRLLGLEIAPDAVRAVGVARSGDQGFVSSEVEKRVEAQPVAVAGTINSSLFEAGRAAGLPMPVLLALIRSYAHEVDFQRDLQSGDRFAVVYERMQTDEGKEAGVGELLHASLTLGGRTLPIYRYRTRDGRVDFYNRDGESIRRSLLRTPIDGARLTSGFGMRRHPILGFSKMHKGVDFGAPRGTPVFAAGHGVVVEAGGKGSYGNYVRLRHNNAVETAYAHLSRFGADIRRGVEVEQGEVIGYVGSTGRSTGPHLHYEVLRNGRQIDPRSIDLPIGRKLEGRELTAFAEHVRSMDRLQDQLLSGVALVKAPGALSVVPRKPELGCAAGC